MRTYYEKVVLTMTLAMGGILGLASHSHAQYGSSFYYSNPRTGFTYSQSYGVGNNSAYSGFSVTRGGRTTSAGSGYNGRHYYQHQYHSTPNYGYRGQSHYAPGFYQNSTSYIRK